MTDDFYLYAFSVTFDQTSHLISAINFSTKSSIPFQSSLVSLNNSKWIAVVSVSSIMIFDCRAFLLSEIYLIENSDFLKISDVQLLEDQYLVIADLRNIYVYLLHEMTPSYKLIDKVSCP